MFFCENELDNANNLSCIQDIHYILLFIKLMLLFQNALPLLFRSKNFCVLLEYNANMHLQLPGLLTGNPDLGKYA